MTIKTNSEHKSFGGTQGVYTHRSITVSGEMEFSVFIPPQATKGDVPVLYYLSGLTCTPDNATTKSGFQSIASELGLAIVCPDTSPRGTDYPGEHDAYDFGSGAGFYLDATVQPWAATYRMYSYVACELPGLIAKQFPVDPSRAGIFGHSMGGHGALTIGLRNPDKFCSISAFAPIVSPTQVPWGQRALAGYLGDERKDWQLYDAVELIRSGHKTAGLLLIDQGLADPFYDEQLKPLLLQEACAKAGQAVEIRLHEGYDHSYYFISTFMKDHIHHHAKLLKTSTAAWGS